MPSSSKSKSVVPLVYEYHAASTSLDVGSLQHQKQLLASVSEKKAALQTNDIGESRTLEAAWVLSHHERGSKAIHYVNVRHQSVKTIFLDDNQTVCLEDLIRELGCKNFDAKKRTVLIEEIGSSHHRTLASKLLHRHDVESFVQAVQKAVAVHNQFILEGRPLSDDNTATYLSALTTAIEAYQEFVKSYLHELFEQQGVHLGEQFYKQNFYTLANNSGQTFDVGMLCDNLSSVYAVAVSPQTLTVKVGDLATFLPEQSVQPVLQAIHDLGCLVPNAQFVRYDAAKYQEAYNAHLLFNQNLREGKNLFVDYLTSTTKSLYPDIQITESSLQSSKDAATIRALRKECCVYRDYLAQKLPTDVYNLGLLDPHHLKLVEKNKIYIEVNREGIVYHVKPSCDVSKTAFTNGQSIDKKGTITGKMSFAALGLDAAVTSPTVWQLQASFETILQHTQLPVAHAGAVDMRPTTLKKYHKVQQLIHILDDHSLKSEQKLATFRAHFDESKAMISQHRDSGAMLFFKRVGVILSSLFCGLGVAVSASRTGSWNFFKAKGQVAAEKIEQALGLSAAPTATS